MVISSEPRTLTMSFNVFLQIYQISLFGPCKSRRIYLLETFKKTVKTLSNEVKFNWRDDKKPRIEIEIHLRTKPLSASYLYQQKPSLTNK